MREYTFRYDDGAGTIVTKSHLFDNDRDALDAASLTFERFHVQVSREKAVIGAFPAGGAKNARFNEPGVILA